MIAMSSPGCWRHSGRYSDCLISVLNDRDVFSRVLATFRTVFWSLFGRGEPDAVRLGSYNNSLTEDVGYIIYGIYNIVMVTVLINMLIAMMTRSFTNIAVSTRTEDVSARPSPVVL